MSDLEARDSNGKQIAIGRLSNLIAIGSDRQTEVIQKAMARAIKDKLVLPKTMEIGVVNKKTFISLPEDDRALGMTNHALGQLCTMIEIPKTYVNNLLEDCAGMDDNARWGLLQDIFKVHLQQGTFLDRKKKPAKFLLRYMNDKLHAVLSRSYNRMLGTAMMMQPFLAECANAGAKPTEALYDDLKTSLKCMQPVVYEPIDGEFVAFGATYTNSDFGAGGLVVSGSILRIMSGTTSVLESKLKKIHLGALIKESDIELSQETMQHEARAHAGAVRDMVKEIFSEKNVEETLDIIRAAHEKGISWGALTSKARKFLNESELELLKGLLSKSKDGTVDLPPITINSLGDPEANAWWASAALGQIADNIADVERKVEIQELAGDLLK